MGTGKSSVGKRLARELGLRFVDADDLIEKDAGMSIKEIFGRFGEARFREMERKVLKAVTETMDGVVLATGGGAVVDYRNRELLRSWGVVVCLTASVEAILDRVDEGDERPLLEVEDRRDYIERLLKERHHAYMDADLVLDTTEKSIAEVTEDIRRFLSMREEA